MKKTCTISPASGLRQQLRTGLLTLGGMLMVSAALAQSFPRNESFKNASAANFSFGGAARLTGTGGANDPVGAGYLRLTDAVNNQAGYVIDNVGFPSSAGFTISFEFFSYGGSTPGADGFSVFLVDANQPSGGFVIGATGGSLGYAQKTVSPVSDGVTKGYIGIGIDEFGNYSNGQEGRSGGSTVLDANGRVANGIAIRGAGNGSAATDYPYLTGTEPGALDFSLDVNTTRAQPGDADYRRAFIDVVPTTVGGVTTYRISVRIQHGDAIRTAIDNFVVPTPPQNLRLGFSGSTGGSTNVHEIRTLNIVQVPFANTDIVSTPYNQAITIPVLNNDVAPGSSIDVTSVDLDPNTAGQQTSLAVAGKGTFAVDNLGVVTFTPSGTFAGTVAVPYTMQSILGPDYTSSPANIRVTVNGADLAATINGPATTTAGSIITYAMTTVNQGSVTALNVVPKIKLPASMPTATVVPTAGGVYDQATGWVTFTPITSLTTGAPAVASGVTFKVPIGSPSTMTGQAVTTSSSVPDPQMSNNTAAVTTNVGAPLPVELTAFTAVAVRNEARLNWVTASEKNSDRFEVERSVDAAKFEKIGTVRGQGSTTTTSKYELRDPQAGQLSRTTVYYRLRQVDVDGQTSFSPVRVVQFAPAGQWNVSVYPNPKPRQSQATLDLTGLPVGTYEVGLMDMRGRQLGHFSLAGAQEHPLNVQSLPPGLYLIRVQGATQTTTLRFVNN